MIDATTKERNVYRAYVKKHGIPVITTMVTRPKGSWKWQDAYALSDYRLVLTLDGNIVWKHQGRGPKRSEPQLRGITSLRGRPTDKLARDILGINTEGDA